MSHCRLILLIGLPGSGKSTLAQRWTTDRPERLLISTDDIRAQLFGDEAVQGPWLQIWQEIGRQFRVAAGQISQGTAREAIYDATNAVRRNRRDAIALARSCGFTQVTGLWLDVPLEICLERNKRRDRQVPDSVIQRMHRCLMGAPPSMQEELNHLLHYAFFGKPTR